MIPRSLHTPLAGTAVVVLALAAIAVPLAKLTRSSADAKGGALDPVASAVSPTRPDEATPPARVPAVARIRLLQPAEELTLRTSRGEVLLALRELPAGESEHDLQIPLAQGQTCMLLDARMTPAANETAVFVTLMPDGYEDRTAYAIGSSPMQQSLQFSWGTHAD